MNIFILDSDVYKCAEYVHDTHANKMLIETGQLLSTAIWCLNSAWAEEQYPKIYLLTHYNHPMNKWVRANYFNFEWTYQLFKAYSNEYVYRFNKTHLTTKKLSKTFKIYIDQFLKKDLPQKNDMQIPLCMPNKYKIDDNIIESYRNFYINEKLTDKNGKSLEKWTNRKRPFWIN